MKDPDLSALVGYKTDIRLFSHIEKMSSTRGGVKYLGRFDVLFALSLIEILLIDPVPN